MQTKSLHTSHPEQGRVALLATAAPSKTGRGQAEPCFLPSCAAFLSLDTTPQPTPAELAEGQGTRNEFCRSLQDGLKNSHFCSTTRAGRSEDRFAEHELQRKVQMQSVGWTFHLCKCRLDFWVFLLALSELDEMTQTIEQPQVRKTS